jgi:hypothetical protein
MLLSKPLEENIPVVWATAPPARARARIEDFILNVKVIVERVIYQ